MPSTLGVPVMVRVALAPAAMVPMVHKGVLALGAVMEPAVVANAKEEKLVVVMLVSVSFTLAMLAVQLLQMLVLRYSCRDLSRRVYLSGKEPVANRPFFPLLAQKTP